MINEPTFIFGEYTPPEIYWRPRFYPAGGLYSTVSDLSHFLIAHMNEGVYKDTRILEKETVELMHEIQPDNNIGYGLAWMQTIISPRLTTSGHAGDLPGTDTWMLYNQTEDIGVIYLANGNPYYGLLPLKGLLSCQWILYSLFTKQGALTGEKQQEFTVSTNPSLLRSFLAPHSLLG
jgi:CubicO group peptidase (beta-lactamase class C family)